jgi:hypothetical protein
MTDQAQAPDPPDMEWRGIEVEDGEEIATAVAKVGGVLSPRFFVPSKTSPPGNWRDPAPAFGYRIMAAWALDQSAKAEQRGRHVEALLKERDSAIRLAGGSDYIETAVKHILFRAERAETERDEARSWVRRLTAEQRVLTCAFCGDAYPPGTPETNHEALTAHVKVCAKHPLAGRIDPSDLDEALAAVDVVHYPIAAGIDTGTAVWALKTRLAVATTILRRLGVTVQPEEGSPK